ncbi:MAG TPA: hypothetical protein VFG09_12050 [Thermodesulfovibrionales bacterium]|jgi:hypothetical protein|nr:hypothetical protein [Thermodesulfovibrionales bacterium]
MVVSENIKDYGKIRAAVWAILFLWLVAVLILGANGVFVREPGTPPLPIFAGVVIPLLVFLAAFWSGGLFRDFVMTLDLEVAAGIQAWRFGGLGFIALYAYGVLPGLFAWPAGLGDMAIGLTAPFIVLALRRRPDFIRSRIFVVWNLLGILDLINAVTLGALSAFLGIGITGEITTFPMAQLPLVLIPAFLVPLFVMLHLTSVFQARRLIAAGKNCGWTGSPTQCGHAHPLGRT